MEKICYLVGAGIFDSTAFAPEQADYIIAADGGYLALEKLGIVPDLLVGDFDSIGSVPVHSNIIRHPVVKDETDMMLAVRQGLELGYRLFYLFGGTGGRLDHTLANIQLLTYLAGQGARGYLAGDGRLMTVVRDGTYHFENGHSGILSAFCLSDRAEDVTIRGLKYPLSNAVLTNDNPLGISNEFLGKEAIFTVKKGIILLMWEMPSVFDNDI